MRSLVLYRLVRETWGATLHSSDFRRVPKSQASWYQRHEGHNLLLTVQASAKGWGEFEGSNFCIEFALSTGTDLYSADFDYRGRFGECLSQAALDGILQHQNEVIGRLRRPLASEAGFQDSDPTGDAYLRHFFDPQEEMFPNDLHLRYYDESDVRSWLRLLEPQLLPEVICFHNRCLPNFSQGRKRQCQR